MLEVDDVTILYYILPPLLAQFSGLLHRLLITLPAGGGRRRRRGRDQLDRCNDVT